MEKKLLLVCCISAFAGPVFADTTAISTGLAEAAAKAISGGGSAEISQSFTTKPTEIPVPQVNPYAAPAGSPALFQLFANSPTLAGIPPTLLFEALCGPTVLTAGNAGVVIEGPGKSGSTNVQFAARPESVRSGDTTVTSVSSGIPDGAEVVCGGVMQIDATKGNTSMGIVLNDARTFPLGKFQGHRHAYVVTVPEALAAAVGVNTEGDGYSLGASGSGSGNPLSFLLGLFGSKSGISGVTKPVFYAGTTMYVFFAKESPNEKTVVFNPQKIVPPKPVAAVNGAKPQQLTAPMQSVATGTPSNIDDATRAKALELARKAATTK